MQSLFVLKIIIIEYLIKYIQNYVKIYIRSNIKNKSHNIYKIERKKYNSILVKTDEKIVIVIDYFFCFISDRVFKRC